MRAQLLVQRREASRTIESPFPLTHLLIHNRLLAPHSKFRLPAAEQDAGVNPTKPEPI